MTVLKTLPTLPTLFTWTVLPLRLALVLSCVLAGLLVQITCFAWMRSPVRQRIVTVWSRAMLASLGVRLTLSNAASLKLISTSTAQAGSAAQAMVLCNHISWLDILALQAAAPVVFVAKSEIRSWPVLGWMVSLAGTCFIERDRRSALRGVHRTLTQHLQAGQMVCIFPEGTTSNGAQVLPFHAGLLQAAIDANVPVQPMSLQYSHTNAAYIDDMTLVDSLMNVLTTPALGVTVRILAPLASTEHKRQALAALAHEAITQSLNTPLIIS